MDDALQSLLDRAVDAYEAAAPEGWIRIVLWCGRLLEDDGSTAGFKLPCVAATYGPDGLGQDYVIPPAADRLSAVELDRAVQGRPEEGWTMLKVEADRDGRRTFDFHREAARPLDDSATDAYWDGIHEYVDRNRDELDRLVERLREHDALPSASEAETDQSKGGRGRLFGRR